MSNLIRIVKIAILTLAILIFLNLALEATNILYKIGYFFVIIFFTITIDELVLYWNFLIRIILMAIPLLASTIAIFKIFN